MCSDLTLDPCFKVKQGLPSLKVLITPLLLKNDVSLQNHVSFPFLVGLWSSSGCESSLVEIIGSFLYKNQLAKEGTE